MDIEDIKEINDMSNDEISGMLGDIADGLQDENLTNENKELVHYLYFILLKRNDKKNEIMIILKNT